MNDGGTALQAAIYTALTVPAITSSFSAGAAVPVYDLVPQDSAYPHIELAADMQRQWSAAAIHGEDHTFEVHVWSRYAGYQECRQIMAAVRAAVDEVALPLTGAALVDIQFDSEDVLKDIDGLTVHGIVRFHALITAV